MQKSDEVELKGGMYTFMSLRLHTIDLDIIAERLAQKVHQAPGFFRDTPVVVDFSALEGMPGIEIDTERLLACIREHRLLPIVASVADKSSALAASIALPLVEGGARRQNNSTRGTMAVTGVATPQQPAAERQNEPSLISGAGRAGGTQAPTEANDDAEQLDADLNAEPDSASGGEPEHLLPPAEVEFVIKAPMLITRPVRSGQQLYARGTDLIVMGPVGPGAEVIADNNIHVYGPLRGRALCGVSGNTETRIFCQSLEAELVSVAGNFKLLENIPEDLRGKPAQIWLDKDRLNIEPL